MPMSAPLAFATDDGFRTTIAEQPDQSLRVTVTLGERSWTADRATIEDAIGVAMRIRQGEALPDHTPQTPSHSSPITD